jgi:ABC-type bacteriocin/lantibiotic exporter with double-glycine peptidase domain
MIKDFLQKYIVEHEKSSDGGIESLLKIIKHYKGVSSPENLNFLIQNYYPKSSNNLLIKAAKNSGLTAVSCHEVTLIDIIAYNQPLIIKFRDKKNTTHFVLFTSFSNKNGFSIWDSRKDSYFLSKEQFEEEWCANECIAFIA